MKAEIKVAIGLAVIAVAAVAASSGAQSFGHMYDWARINGEPEWRSYLFPISVDGMMVAATVVLYVDNRLNLPPHRLAHLLLAAGVFVSVSANVLHDWASVFAEKWIWGWGPLALFGSFHLIMQFVRSLAVVFAAMASEAKVVPEVVSVPDAAPVPADEPETKPKPEKKTAAPKGSVPKPSQDEPVNDVEMQAARHADRAYRVENGGKPITRDALKTALAPCGTTKATALLAALKKERKAA